MERAHGLTAEPGRFSRFPCGSAQTPVLDTCPPAATVGLWPGKKETHTRRNTTHLLKQFLVANLVHELEALDGFLLRDADELLLKRTRAAHTHTE